jgi:hypothetical protein
MASDDHGGDDGHGIPADVPRIFEAALLDAQAGRAQSGDQPAARRRMGLDHRAEAARRAAYRRTPRRRSRSRCAPWRRRTRLLVALAEDAAAPRMRTVFTFTNSCMPNAELAAVADFFTPPREACRPTRPSVDETLPAQLAGESPDFFSSRDQRRQLKRESFAAAMASLGRGRS